LNSEKGRAEVALANHKSAATPTQKVGSALVTQQERLVPWMRTCLTIVDDDQILIEFVDGEMRLDGEPSESLATISILSDIPIDIAYIFFRAGMLFPQRSVRGARYDESLDLFRLTWNSRSFPGRMLFLLGPRALGRAHSLPPDLIEKISEKYSKETDFADLTIRDGELEFLRKASRAMGFFRTELRIDVLGRGGIKLLSQLELGNIIARFFFADGGFITQDRLSYGQKRLLMFYYYLAANPDIVIADELVNGLHHQWITACIEEIGERQAFLTSQNPLLLDYLAFTSPEQVRKSFVLCTSERVEGQKPEWTWSNMSEEAANEFYSAYQVGIEHVSEILQTQGLF
jgi:hypothetical protein